MKQKKKMTLRRRFRRWNRRLRRRHPALARFIGFLTGLIVCCLALLIFGLLMRAFLWEPEGQASQEPAAAETPLPTAVPAPTAAPTAAPTPTAVPTPTPSPTPGPTPSPTPTPVPTPTPETVDGVLKAHFYQTAGEIAEESDPETNGLIDRVWVYRNGTATEEYSREEEIHFAPAAEYTGLEGVTTFRGNNHRDTAAYGTIPENPTGLEIVWKRSIGALDTWGGVGWTGQASAVRWPEELRLQMNIDEAKRTKDGLVEVMYATLDGKIYFLDLEDGQSTRPPISIGAPIKGSLTVDPRGYPLLYCGQGIYDVGGVRLKCGTRIWSLLDQSQLYFLNGQDERAKRAWRAFDSAPLIDGGTDTMIQVGENGVLYVVDLNTEWTEDSISVDPTVDRYVYTQEAEGKLGTENSVAAYNQYVYFATNIGIIQCVDVNTMELIWCFDTGDDVDATLVIDVEEDGRVALYAVNEVDLRGGRGQAQMFKLDALSGELLWSVDSDPIRHNDENGGGGFATPALGRQSLSHLVFFNVSRTVDSGSMLYALDKQTGERVWACPLLRYSWSSPVCVYTESGAGYIVVGNSSGALGLVDGLTGQAVALVDLGTNIEASPVVFDDMIVVGTRGQRIFGVKIR